MQFEYNKQSHNTIYGGTIDATPIGSTTPAAGYFTPAISKGPAIITSFAGTVTATASTTVTFSSAADAILAGYHATNPVLGATLISNALTRYIVSWTNATTCVVDSSVTWAGTAITSVQLPIVTFVDSAGATQGWMLASGVTYFVQSVGIGTTVEVIGDIISKGTSWTTRTSAADNTWYSVTYGNGLFVAVASSGTGNRVMTSGKTELNPLAHNNIYQGGMSIFGNVGIGTTTPGAKLDVNGQVNQETYAIRKVIAKAGIADNTATSIFRITTTNEAGSTDGGGYSVKLHALVGHAISSDAVDLAAKSFTAQFAHVINGDGTVAASSNVSTDISTASATTSVTNRDIADITVTTQNPTAYLVDVRFQVDLTGQTVTTAQVVCLVELIWYGFLTAPTITAL